jgi:hypothetical protein
VPVAARAAAALGLSGNLMAAVDAARSKLRTREESARAGLPTPRSQRVRSLDELFAAAEAIGFPSVVKPEFGASAVGCVRIDSFESLPGVYKIVRSELATTDVVDLRARNDLLLEEYLDRVEFDVDLVLHDGECVFSSVSQNWPTAEPSFQETGLHCPPDHSAKPVRRLVQLCVETVQALDPVAGRGRAAPTAGRGCARRAGEPYLTITDGLGRRVAPPRALGRVAVRGPVRCLGGSVGRRGRGGCGCFRRARRAS